MIKQRFFTVLLVIILTATVACRKENIRNNIIWSDKPAEYFEEAFPLGNGFSGMMIGGGLSTEDILLNESTLWTGGPVNARMNPDAWKNLAGVRKALFSENYKLAESLIRKIQGKFSESYAPFGNLVIGFENQGKPVEYRRSLDLSSGIAKVEYLAEGKKFSREFFISNPQGSFDKTELRQSGISGFHPFCKKPVAFQLYSLRQFTCYGGLCSGSCCSKLPWKCAWCRCL